MLAAKISKVPSENALEGAGKQYISEAGNYDVEVFLIPWCGGT